MGCCISKKSENLLADTSDKKVFQKSIKSNQELDITSPLHQSTGNVLDQHGHLIAYHIDSFGNKVDDKTGARVFTEKYYTARREAEQHAKTRGECFERSKRAYNADRKADAKSLSDEGKIHGVLVEEKNKIAVQEILGPQNLKHADKLDLHGLHLNEAVDATREFVNFNIGKKKSVQIITGIGNHSDFKKGPAIKPAILDLCKFEGWEVYQDENNEGSLTLQVPIKHTGVPCS